MTPAELARSMDPETLRDTLQRVASLLPDGGQTRRAVMAADTAGLVRIASDMNARRKAGNQIKHGLLPRCHSCHEAQALILWDAKGLQHLGDCRECAP